MADKVYFKLFTNIVANIALFITYAILFGKQSIDKYLDEGVTILNYEEKPPNIMPPGT